MELVQWQCKASMDWLYTVLNPTKSAPFAWLYMYSTETTKIKQNQGADFDGLQVILKKERMNPTYFLNMVVGLWSL